MQDYNKKGFPSPSNGKQQPYDTTNSDTKIKINKPQF